MGIMFVVNLNNEVVFFELIYGIFNCIVGEDSVNLISSILSVVMMLCFMGWYEVVNKIEKVLE